MDTLFDVENYPESIIYWLGVYSPESIKRIIKEKYVNEIILAEGALNSFRALEILTSTHKLSIKTAMMMRYAELIHEDTRIHNLGKTGIPNRDGHIRCNPLSRYDDTKV